MQVHHPSWRRTVLSAAVVAVLALVGSAAYVVLKLGVFAPSLADQIAKVERSRDAWWLGRSFEGLPIAYVGTAGGDRVDDVGYGACRRFGGRLDPFANTRCGYPLLIQVRKRRYALSLDELPRQLDGSCTRTTIRGAPAVVGPEGAILYTGAIAIAALGRPERVGRALADVHPVGTAHRRLARPTLGVDALANCRAASNPFMPLAGRLAVLRRTGLPLAWVGPWYAGGQLTGAGRAGAAAVLSYTSCGRASGVGSCLETLSLSSEPRDQGALRATLSGATCRTFDAAGAPGVAWTKDLSGETGGGVIVFSGSAAISLANDITLEKIPMSRLETVAGLVRPLPPARSLPRPSYDIRRLLGACAERAPVG